MGDPPVVREGVDDDATGRLPIGEGQLCLMFLLFLDSLLGRNSPDTAVCIEPRSSIDSTLMNDLLRQSCATGAPAERTTPFVRASLIFTCWEAFRAAARHTGTVLKGGGGGRWNGGPSAECGVELTSVSSSPLSPRTIILYPVSRHVVQHT